MKVVLDNKSKEILMEGLSKNSRRNAVRILAAMSCWGGTTFTLALDEQRDKDISTEVEGIKFVTHKDYGIVVVNVDITYDDKSVKENFGDNFKVNVSK